MNRKNIVDNINKKNSPSIEDLEMISAIREAKEDWKTAALYFELVDEPALVDYAIYLQQAARTRYTYLLKKAKEQNIKVAYCDVAGIS